MGILKVLKQMCTAFTTFWPVAIWITINYFIFKKHYSKYKNAPEHYLLRMIIGHGLCISRATAAMLNFCCCILLLPMCRSINLILHHFLGLISQSALMFWIKNSRNFHVMCASTVILVSVAHTIAHCINAMNFSLHYDDQYPLLNWAKYSGQPVWEMIFTSVVGITGVSMICILVAMSVTSIKYIRQEHYQIFWIVHHLYLLFLIVLLCHPLSGELKQIANSQNITNCYSYIKNASNGYNVLFKNNTLCANKPAFIAMQSETWMWIVPPFIIIVVDRIFWSLKRNRKRLYVLQVKRLPGSTIHLVLQSPSLNFVCRPGQYILLQCPVISTLEWHPFSVVDFDASAQSSLSVLIRAKGDWTEELLGRVLVPFAHHQEVSEIFNKPSGKPVWFLLDGPFRSSLEEILNSSIAICIAAGIGITPFICIFNYLLSSISQETPKRLHLMWLVRDPQQLIWCAKVLCNLHEKYWNDNVPDRFIIQIHITRDFNAVELQESLNDEYKLLLHRIQKGRPVWSEIFHQIREMYSGKCVHIFTSGPDTLVAEINNYCKKIYDKNITLRYSHETF